MTPPKHGYRGTKRWRLICKATLPEFSAFTFPKGYGPDAAKELAEVLRVEAKRQAVEAAIGNAPVLDLGHWPYLVEESATGKGKKGPQTEDAAA